MRRVLVDIDGVVVDILSSLKVVLSNEGYEFKPENVDTYDFHGDIGCPREVVFYQLKHQAVFRQQILYDGVKDALELLKNVAEVWAYTKVEPNPFIMCERKKLMQDLGLKGDIYIGDSSKECEKPVYLGFDAVFEDSVGVLGDWHSCMNNNWQGAVPITPNEKVFNLQNKKTRFYLIDHTYNRDEDNSDLWKSIVRCKDFADAVGKYVEEFK